MLFNSFEFLLFLPLAWAAYWALSGCLRLQNLQVVAASYVFYGWWDWRFLSLIALHERLVVVGLSSGTNYDIISASTSKGVKWADSAELFPAGIA